jgi:NAD(P)-dependent dehydrogenase (short-subunit alcohol dehydrogenase family)
MSNSRVQQPLGSGFGRASTATEVLKDRDLSGRNYIVTGGYSGLGLETVRALVNAGAHVTAPARSRAKSDAALADIPGVVVADMDLADLASVRRFASDYVAGGRPLHGLVNNAAVMACPLERVGQGWESQIGICHIGHFELASGLEAAIKREGGRVVALSSIGHARGGIQWDDPHYNARPYDKWEAYGQAKTADALFALGLDDRWASDGVRAFSVHPGGIFTPLQRHLADEEMVALGWKNADGAVPPQVAAMFKSPEAGAATTVWALTSDRLDGLGGLYCEDCDVARAADETSQRWEHVRPWAVSEEGAKRLWEMTEGWVASV